MKNQPDFYSFVFNNGECEQPQSVAMDEEERQNGEGFITIRRIFTIDKNMIDSLGREKGENADGDENRYAKGETDWNSNGVRAEDSAVFISGIAMDLSPRHSNTPIEECRAEDPRYCPYHGAAAMSKELDWQFRAAGIYAHGGIERIGQGRYRLQYTIAPSRREQANMIINGYLSQPGFSDVTEEENDEDVIDAVQKGFKTGKNNDYAMYHEYIDMLRSDMEKGMDIDRGDLARLEAEHATIGEMKKSAHEALNDAERANELLPKKQRKTKTQVKADCQPWQDYIGMWKKMEDDYNTIRGNADLSHVKSIEDAREVADMMNSQLDKIGDFVRADQEIRKMKAEKNLKGVKGIDGTDDYNTAARSLCGSIGSTITAAREKLADAMANGDIKRMRGALHKLEKGVDEAKERKGEIRGFMALASAYRKTIEMTPARAAKGDAEKTAAKAEEPQIGQPAITPEGVEPNEEEKAEAPETAVVIAGETGTQSPVNPDESHVERPTPPEENSDVKPRQTSNSEASIEHNMTDNTDSEPTDDDIRDLVNKYAQKHHINQSGRDIDVDVREMRNFLKKAQSGQFDNSPAGGGINSNDNQFLNDIIAVVGEEHTFVKAIRRALDGNDGRTESEPNTIPTEETKEPTSDGDASPNTEESGVSEKNESSEKGDITPYYEFLRGLNDDREVLYGNAGLSADIDYDNYLKRMDDAIGQALQSVDRYEGSDLNEFTMETAENLKRELEAIANEQMSGENAKEESPERKTGVAPVSGESIPAETNIQPGSLADEMNLDTSDEKGSVAKAAEIMSADLMELANMESIVDSLNSSDRDDFKQYCKMLTDSAVQQLKDDIGESDPLVAVIAEEHAKGNGAAKSNEQSPEDKNESENPPSEDIQTGEDVKESDGAQDDDTADGDEPVIVDSGVNEGQEPNVGENNDPTTIPVNASETKPESQNGEGNRKDGVDAGSEKQTEANTDENVLNFKNAVKESLPTFRQFYRDGRDIAIVTNEDDNGGAAKPQSVDSVREMMRKSGIDGAIMAIPADVGDGPNSPKKVVYMIRLRKAE